MKIYAQHGAMAGEKMREGFQKQFLNGIIYSPRDIAPINLRQQLDIYVKNSPSIDLLLDPQYYTSILDHTEPIRLGYLADDYPKLHSVRRRVDLGRQSIIEQDMRESMAFQCSLPLTHVIAPNILISHSFDSRETGYSIDFLRIAETSWKKQRCSKPVLLTLAMSRDTLLSRTALFDFVNELTGLSLDAAGFYVLVAAAAGDARSQIYHADVVAGWMYLNYALNSNGYEVVNGYSDLLTPFLGVAGATAGASGWWSNLRNFSLERFAMTSGGGRLPIQRYLSRVLLNRITFAEFDLLRRQVPEVVNGLSTDELYPEQDGSEPVRSQEVMQSWETIQAICNAVTGAGSTIQGLAALQGLIRTAEATYLRCQQVGIRLDPKSNDEHIEALSEGLRTFEEMAELDTSTE